MIIRQLFTADFWRQLLPHWTVARLVCSVGTIVAAAGFIAALWGHFGFGVGAMFFTGAIVYFVGATIAFIGYRLCPWAIEGGGAAGLWLRWQLDGYPWRRKQPR